MNDDQIVEITRGQLDEICRERDKFKAGYAEACECITAQERSIDELHEQLAASHAREEKLREALEDIKFCTAPEPDDGSHHENAYWIATETLALPTDDTALQARLAEERERCALCVEAYSMDWVACARAIRSMK